MWKVLSVTHREMKRRPPPGPSVVGFIVKPGGGLARSRCAARLYLNLDLISVSQVETNSEESLQQGGTRNAER